VVKVGNGYGVYVGGLSKRGYERIRRASKPLYLTKPGVVEKYIEYKGKRYRYYGDVPTKAEAKALAEKFRKEGYLVQIRKWKGFGRVSYEIYTRLAERKPRKPSKKQIQAAKKNIKKAIKASEKISEREHRKTLTKSGRVVTVPEDEYLYLGRTVRDVGPKGYSHISEVRGTLRRIEVDLKRGVISRKTANARIMRLKAIVEQSKQGELGTASGKRKAVSIINEHRIKLGFSPVEPSTGPRRPTPAQKRAAKRNIKKAQAAWRAMHS